MDAGGICSKNKYYRWDEIERFTLNKRSALAYIKFSDGKGRFIFTQRFRLKGKPLTLTLLGKNETFIQFHTLIRKKISENELDPDYKRFRGECNDLKRAIDQATTDAERRDLSKRWAKLNHELLALDAAGRERHRTKIAKIHRDMIIGFILISVLAIWAVVS